MLPLFVAGAVIAFSIIAWIVGMCVVRVVGGMSRLKRLENGSGCIVLPLELIG